MIRSGERLLVTGAGGHVGGEFLRRLAGRGHDGPVRVAARSARGLDEMRVLPLDLEVVRGDLRNEAVGAEAGRGVDVVVHVANLYASPSVVAGAPDARRVICVHTTGRYSRFKSAREAYERIEDGLLARHDHLTVLRPTMIYGSRRAWAVSWLIRQMARRRVMPMVGRGRNLMQPVLARDVADALMAVLDRDATARQAYDLPGRAAVPYSQMLRTISRALGRQHLLVPVPLGPARRVAAAVRARRPGFPIQDEQLLRMSEDKAFDWSAAAAGFGYDPAGIEEGIAEHVADMAGELGRRP